MHCVMHANRGVWTSHSAKHCAHLNIVCWAQVSAEEGANDQHHCCSSAQILEEEVLNNGGRISVPANL